MEVEKETEIWFAMRATYRRETDAMRLLAKENLGCFVPMQYKISIKKGKKVRVLVPIIHNLIFIHACPSEVKRVKSMVAYLQYITDTRSGKKIIIPDNEMQRFIAVAGSLYIALYYNLLPMNSTCPKEPKSVLQVVTLRVRKVFS